MKRENAELMRLLVPVHDDTASTDTGSADGDATEESGFELANEDFFPAMDEEMEVEEGEEIWLMKTQA